MERHSTPRAFREVAGGAWRSSRALTAWAVADALLRGVLPVAQIVATGAVVDGLTRRDRLAPAVATLSAIILANAVLQLATPLTIELSRRVDRHMRLRFMRAVMGPDGIEHLEDPATQNHLSAAQGLGSQAFTPGAAVRGYLALITWKISTFGSLALLFGFRWWLPAGMLAFAVPMRRTILRNWFRGAQALRGEIPGLRRSAYLRDLALRPGAAKESRLFGLGAWVRHRYGETWLRAMEPVWRERSTIVRTNVLVSAASFVLGCAAVIPVVLALMSGDVPVGNAVVLCQAVGTAVLWAGFLPEADTPIRYGALALPGLLALESRASSPLAGGRSAAGMPDRSIRFERVSFTYPGTERAVYTHLDLEVVAGRSLAIVGANGAGKTTALKLLTRMYEPVAGRITVDGVDVRDLDADSWRRQIAVIFQDFVRYELSARDNIGFGALDLAGDDAALRDAAERAGAADVIERVGWHTPLSRRYLGGADLSGGQWQRIALARALLAVRGGARVLVLDEPTASLDVRAEAEFFDRFLSLTHGLTTVIVSHRFSTVRRADRICVLEDGRVSEDGTHASLMQLGGTYARMYTVQAARFADA